MKLHYYEDTDSLYIDLAAAVSADSKEIADGLVMDYDDSGHIVGIDIQHASERIDPSRSGNQPPSAHVTGGVTNMEIARCKSRLSLLGLL